MSRPIFVIGAQRNGTTITDELVRRCSRVGNDTFNPHGRWDVAFMAAAGGGLPSQPLRTRLDRWLHHRPAAWATVKLALPFAYESFGWPALADMYAGARFVLIVRDWFDSHASWSEMPHVKTIGVRVAVESYRVWHDRLQTQLVEFARSHDERCVLLSYEALVRGADGTMAPVWTMLNVPAPSDLQKAIRLPVHWCRDEQEHLP